MKTNLIVLIAVLIIPLVALGAGLLVERLMGPRARRQRRTLGRPRAGQRQSSTPPRRGAPQG